MGIAETAVSDAEHVKCEGRDFVFGLHSIIVHLKERLALAQDEFDISDADLKNEDGFFDEPANGDAEDADVVVVGQEFHGQGEDR